MASKTEQSPEPDEPTYDVVDADGVYVSGPWFKDQAERLAKRDWAAGRETYTRQRGEGA